MSDPLPNTELNPLWLLHKDWHAGALAGGNPSASIGFQKIFQDWLAPLTPDTFQEVIGSIQQNVLFLNQVLALLEHQEWDGLLHSMLQAVTLKIGELLRADRATIFLLDPQQQELWSLVAQREGDEPLEIRIPADQGIAGQVAQLRQVVNIPYDFYDDPRSETAKQLDQTNGYRTYSLLTLPLLNHHQAVIAVVQLVNKVVPEPEGGSLPLAQRVDRSGFTDQDEALIQEFGGAIALLLESAQSFDRASRRHRAGEALMRATQFLSEASLDWETALVKVLAEAKSFIQVQHCDLWLINRDRSVLWRPCGSSPQRIELPLEHSWLGSVVQAGQPLRRNGLRTGELQPEDLGLSFPAYNLLCMPLMNNQGRLIGLTVLCNKYRQRATPSHPVPRANFDVEDEAFLASFNHQAGIALERAFLMEEMEQTITRRTQELELKHRQLHQEILERKRVEVLLQELNLKLEDLALIDALTQIANRGQFDRTLEREWLRLRREGNPLSLILCDIDHFKQFNDHYGHPRGDRCLYEVAQTIQATAKRPADLAARYGGEEFVILLPNTPLTGAYHLANCVRQSVANLKIPHAHSSAAEWVTLSLGVACLVPEGPAHQAATLIQQADAALYRAKQQGRNQAVMAQSSTPS
ncbi:sensor domain-containing diguanylate cyclase [Lyngbya confervoides]|uniref:Sensor domain-containing diguanylate cyclase n=1 Tax=Lyngbya confervoides BDU141951 TaxID=1574623 RepID=A0ABD4T496_9CYAN|nr:sensor domain-containing diguanylate cyclase [Lyngbya confervoides]MCM1983405.1 sensor domain-containing diguanylate cyclase [Lyngbya confervoides BDU141951]